MKKLKLAVIGCGGRGLTYATLAGRMPDLYDVVAAADPNPARMERVRAASGNASFRAFTNDADILAQDKLADVMVIATQDSAHFAPAKAAMEKGYDILLEKPISTRPAEVLELSRLAERLGRRVLICHVLRYTPFYRKIREVVQSGAIGEIVTVNAVEATGPWHMAHSYVRGHWGVTETSSPMIIAKACHDMDILSWIIGRPCQSVSSFGALTHFTAGKAPAGSPARCTDGCPAGRQCPFNAMHYAGRERAWLGYVFDKEASATTEQIREWLKISPWGRCVYHCDNTAVDHQIMNMKFEGDVTASFTMTAFDAGRCIEIYGTKGFLTGRNERKTENADIVMIEHHTYNRTKWDLNPDAGGYAGHGGGDAVLMTELYAQMTRPDAAAMESSIQRSVQSHLMGFAAEESRTSGQTIHLAEYVKSL